MSKARKNPDTDSLPTKIATNVYLEGKLEANGNIWVDGHLKGSLQSESEVVIDENAKVKADIKARSATISGHVEGNITLKDSLTVTATGTIIGDINAPNLNVEAGANLNGLINMPQDQPEATDSEE